MRFDPVTNEFGVCSADGAVLTFMIVQPLPGSNITAIQYFQTECKK